MLLLAMDPNSSGAQAASDSNFSRVEEKGKKDMPVVKRRKTEGAAKEESTSFSAAGGGAAATGASQWRHGSGVTLAKFLEVGEALGRGLHMRVRCLGGSGDDQESESMQVDISPVLCKVPATSVLSDADLPVELRCGRGGRGGAGAEGAWPSGFLAELRNEEALADVAAAAEFARVAGLAALRALFASEKGRKGKRAKGKAKSKSKAKVDADHSEGSGAMGVAAGVAPLDPVVVRRLGVAPADVHVDDFVAGGSSEVVVEHWKAVHSWSGVESIMLFLCLARKGHLQSHTIAQHFAGYIDLLPGFPGAGDEDRAPDDPTFWGDQEAKDLLGASDLAAEVRAVKALLRAQAAYVVGPRFGISASEWFWARAAYVSRRFGGSGGGRTDAGLALGGSEAMQLKRGATVAVMLPGIDLFNHQQDYPVQVARMPDQSVALLLDKSALAECFADGIYPGLEVFNCYGPKSDHELLLNYGFCLPPPDAEGDAAEEQEGGGGGFNPYDTAGLRLPAAGGTAPLVGRLTAELEHIRGRPAVARRNNALLLSYTAQGGLQLLFQEEAPSRSTGSTTSPPSEPLGSHPMGPTVYLDVPSAKDYLALLEVEARCGGAGAAGGWPARLLALAASRQGALAERLMAALSREAAECRVRVFFGGLIPEELVAGALQRQRQLQQQPPSSSPSPAELKAALGLLRRALNERKIGLLVTPSALTECRLDSDDEEPTTEASGASSAPSAAPLGAAAVAAADAAAAGEPEAAALATQPQASALRARAKRRHAHAFQYLRGQMHLYLRALTWLEAQDI